MINLEADNPSKQQLLAEHPFVVENPVRLTSWLVGKYDGIAAFERDFLQEHRDNPIDLIIGEDVSGRAPTLLTHYFLKLAFQNQDIESVPRVAFIASGLLQYPKIFDMPRRKEKVWQRNINRRVRTIIDTESDTRVVILTERVSSGNSMRRILDAVHYAGVGDVQCRVAKNFPYLGDRMETGEGDRKFTGVEKDIPRPVCKRRRDFNAEEVASFRRFLKFYAELIYSDSIT